MGLTGMSTSAKRMISRTLTKLSSPTRAPAGPSPLSSPTRAPAGPSPLSSPTRAPAGPSPSYPVLLVHLQGLALLQGLLQGLALLVHLQGLARSSTHKIQPLKFTKLRLEFFRLNFSKRNKIRYQEK